MSSKSPRSESMRYDGRRFPTREVRESRFQRSLETAKTRQNLWKEQLRSFEEF